MRLRSTILAFGLLAPALAFAQPAAPPAKPSGDKLDARSLMQSGVRLLEAKDYLGALAVFKDAYARFPSAKILLNIGTTLNLLERKAAAANAYQHYLDSKDADAAKKPEVTAVIADLDKSVGRLDIKVTPGDAEIQVNDDEWTAAASARVVRVEPGSYTVRARRDHYGPETQSGSIRAGDSSRLEIAMVALPMQVSPILSEPEQPAVEQGPRTPYGAIAIARFEPVGPKFGFAAVVGGSYEAPFRLRVDLAAVIGGHFGGYTGGTFAILPGKFRPYLGAGLIVFASNGPRVGIHGAGGLEVEISRRFSILAEFGVERMFNPEDTKLKNAYLPAIGALGRL